MREFSNSVRLSFRVAVLAHIPCNLSFYQCAVNGNHVSVSKFDLDTGGIEIELTGNNLLIHDSVRLN